MRGWLINRFGVMQHYAHASMGIVFLYIIQKVRCEFFKAIILYDC